MAKVKQKENSRDGFHVQFNLVGLVVFSVSLVAVTGALSYAFARPLNKSNSRPELGKTEADVRPAEVPPWGEFSAYDIELERPEEYVAFEIGRAKPVTWTFQGMKVDQVRQLLLKCGLTQQQAERALSPAMVSATATNTVIQPDDDLILSLSTAARGALYGELAKDPVNHYMRFPFCLPGESPSHVLTDCQVEPDFLGRARSRAECRERHPCGQTVPAVGLLR